MDFQSIALPTELPDRGLVSMLQEGHQILTPRGMLTPCQQVPNRKQRGGKCQFGLRVSGKKVSAKPLG